MHLSKRVSSSNFYRFIERTLVASTTILRPSPSLIFKLSSTIFQVFFKSIFRRAFLGPSFGVRFLLIFFVITVQTRPTSSSFLPFRHKFIQLTQINISFLFCNGTSCQPNILNLHYAIGKKGRAVDHRESHIKRTRVLTYAYCEYDL